MEQAVAVRADINPLAAVAVLILAGGILLLWIAVSGQAIMGSLR